MSTQAGKRGSGSQIKLDNEERTDEEYQKLMKLASKQQMGTDVRKAVGSLMCVCVCRMCQRIPPPIPPPSRRRRSSATSTESTAGACCEHRPPPRTPRPLPQSSAASHTHLFRSLSLALWQIFLVMMQSEDYMDAVEKLLKLALKGAEAREIVRVAFHCCVQEKGYNPFYALLLCQLCTIDKNHQFTLRLCMWDALKEVDAWVEAGSVGKSKVACLTSTPGLSGLVCGVLHWPPVRCTGCSVRHCR